MKVYKMMQEDAKAGLKKGHNSALNYVDLLLRTFAGVPRNNKKETKNTKTSKNDPEGRQSKSQKRP